jgi:CubicO group peptidase (beta-lactamase class C family)
LPVLPRSDPESLGLSPARLAHIGETLRQRVETGAFPGAVMMLARRGRLAYAEAFGYRDREAGAAMEPDAIFRIASMTKPLTSLAAMMLVERGALYLGAPLADCLPEFAGLKVAEPRPDGSIDIVPAQRMPTILDLMRHTSGLTYGWTGDSAVKRLYRRDRIDVFSGPTAEFRAALAALPLEFHPGSTWSYGVSTDLLGSVIEAVTGRDLGDVIADTITGPLGMADSGFRVDEPRAHRLAEPGIDPATGKRPGGANVLRRPARAKGGSGMVSTAADYLRFCQFWLNGGELDGVRLVSRKTVELMTADHLPPGVAFDPDMVCLFGPRLPAPQNGMGFGLGFSVRTGIGRAPWHGSVGAYEWIGATGCVFLIDPAEDLGAVLMVQAPDQLAANMSLIRALAYQAIGD